MLRVLFVCSQNKLRSPTAEQVFAGHPGVECTSAGTNNDAENPLTAEFVEWAVFHTYGRFGPLPLKKKLRMEFDVAFAM